MEKKYPSKIPHERFPDAKEDQIHALEKNEQLSAYKVYRDQHRNDRYMPAYHFWAPDGMINDPNGLCYWRGHYHLFYQAYPPADLRQHWGHAISDDLVQWKDLPLAIYPDVEYAVFSGSSLVEDNQVIAMYHGRKAGNMIATSSDPLLLNWEKNPDCPVIPLAPDSVDGKPFRVFDPFIWSENEGYYALSGVYYGKEENRHGGSENRMVEHLFFSQDLSRWTYLGVLMDENPFIECGNDGACPYFWPIGDKHVLFFFSHRTGPYCLVGDYDKVVHKFVPKQKVKFNYGPVGCSSLQAPCATPDGRGGLYVLCNTKDANRSLERQGAMTLMWHVTLDTQGLIRFDPIETIANLHREQYVEKDRLLPAFSEQIISGAHGDALDISVKIDIQNSRSVMIKVFRSDDGREFTSITLYKSEIQAGGGNRRHTYIAIDTTRASLSAEVEGRNPEVAEFESTPNQPVELRIFIDKCMVEVFVNGKIYLMQMAYPTLPDSSGVSFEALGNAAKIHDLNIWTMNGIY
jgi:beta-fructofuranosidase